MSNLALARKWRPKSFATLVGQEHVVKALSHALDQQRLHHAYLLTGTRGVGKTTIARILAKALNCELGVSSTPCGTCSACTKIDSGRYIDYIELDAASNRGVEDMTALLEQAAYAPAQGRYKVYAIDEVHQLSGHAFNAMLKTLEEPPEHVKFILATTDPKKIPVTVLSRCLQFSLKNVPVVGIEEQLAMVLREEAISFEQAALTHLAQAAAGSMRDALSLLDQAIAHDAGNITAKGVRAMLGNVSDDELLEILSGLCEDNFPRMLAVADRIEDNGLSFSSTLQELATLVHRIALAQFAPQAVGEQLEQLSPFAHKMDEEFLQLCYQILIHGRDELALAPDEYSGFTMTLMRLHAFGPEVPNKPLNAQSSPAHAPTSKAGAPFAKADKTGRIEAMPMQPTAMPTMKSDDRVSILQTFSLEQNEPISSAPSQTAIAAKPLMIEVITAPNIKSTESVTEEYQINHETTGASGALAATDTNVPHGAGEQSLTIFWRTLIQRLALDGLTLQLARRCELVARDRNHFSLKLAENSRHLLNDQLMAKLRSKLQKFLATDTDLSIELVPETKATPAYFEQQEAAARIAQAQQSITKDPFVQSAIKIFNAELIPQSIQVLHGENNV